MYIYTHTHTQLHSDRKHIFYWKIRSRSQYVRRFDLVRALPYLAQAHGGVEPVEDGQRHGHVRDDGPGPQAVEVQLYGMGVGARLLQRVDGPHGQVADQQERDDLAAGLPAYLVRRDARPPGRVQYEHRLAERLHQRRGRGEQHQHRVVLLREVAADDRERAVNERARLRAHQQYVVQFQVPQTVELQLPHLRVTTVSTVRFFVRRDKMDGQNHRDLLLIREHSEVNRQCFCIILYIDVQFLSVLSILSAFGLSQKKKKVSNRRPGRVTTRVRSGQTIISGGF